MQKGNLHGLGENPSFRWVDLDIHGYQKALEMILQDYESRY